MPRPFAIIGFTVFFTIALLYNTETGVTAAALAAYAVALVIALFAEKARRERVLPCAFASGALACVLLLANTSFLYLPAVAYSGKSCEITAVLTSEAELEYGNFYYTARATQIDGEAVDLKLRLNFSSHPDAEPYDEVSGKFNFYIPGASSEESLSSNKANGVFVAAYPVSDTYEIKSVPESEKPVGKTIIDIRNAIKNAIYRILPDERGALAVALIIGDKSGLSAETLNDFRTAGISHVICVSGFHLSLWSMIIFELLRKMRVSEKLSSVICAFAVISFMLVSGLTYSVVRAGIMMLVFLLGNVIMRKRDSLNSLGFALMAIALFNPYAMGSVSLQLSALATLGIILYSQNFAHQIENKFERIKYKLPRKALKGIFSTFAVTVAATAFTLPVSLGIYGGFNFAVFAANLVAVPLAGLCMVLCALGALIGSMSMNLLNIPAVFGGRLSEFLIFYARKIAAFDLLSFRVESDESAVIICAVLAVCLFAVVMAYFGKSMPRLACTLAAGVFTVTLLFFSLSEQKLTKIRVVDCGNGTSVVFSGGGENLLIGCGGTEFLGAMNICNAVDSCGGRIDAIIVPGADECSSSYLNKILAQYHPPRISCGDLPQGSSLLLGGTEKSVFGSDFEVGNISVNFEKTQNGHAVLIGNNDVSALVLFDPIADFSSLSEKFRAADMIITRSDYPSGLDGMECALAVINAENQRGVLLQKELSDLGLRCVATAGCGDIIIKADSGILSVNRE